MAQKAFSERVGCKKSDLRLQTGFEGIVHPEYLSQKFKFPIRKSKDSGKASGCVGESRL